jgi:hypothetical protein
VYESYIHVPTKLSSLLSSNDSYPPWRKGPFVYGRFVSNIRRSRYEMYLYEQLRATDLVLLVGVLAVLKHFLMRSPYI